MDGTELANTGDHAALNFLNTRIRPRGQQLELLETGRGLLDWMVSTELIDEAERARLARRFTVAELNDAAAEARELREWLRGQVVSWAADDGPAWSASAAERQLNRVLAQDHQYVQLGESLDGDPELVMRRHWIDASQLVIPAMAAAADLFAHGDRALVRECDGPRCGIWFYDRTKAHRRRWCSQAVCGNRDKVRNHRARVQTS